MQTLLNDKTLTAKQRRVVTSCTRVCLSAAHSLTLQNMVWTDGATENAGLENSGPSKMQGWKTRDWKTRDCLKGGGKRGTKMQGWKTQDWKTRDHHSGGGKRDQ